MGDARRAPPRRADNGTRFRWDKQPAPGIRIHGGVGRALQGGRDLGEFLRGTVRALQGDAPSDDRLVHGEERGRPQGGDLTRGGQTQLGNLVVSQLQATGKPSADTSDHSYNWRPAMRLATRSGSNAEANAMSENLGNNR